MSTTTKGPTARTVEPFTTDRANGPQHIQHPHEEQNVNTIIPQNPDDDQQPYAVGQYVYCQHRSWPVRRTGVVVAIVPPASAAGHDYVAFIIEYPPSVDDHPAVQALAIHNGMHRGLFRAEELQPVPSDDAPPATDADVVTHLTGVLPDVDDQALAADVDEYRCQVDSCDFHIVAAGPLELDEPDYFAEEVEAHRQSHEPRSDVDELDTTTATEEHPSAGAGHRGDDVPPINHGWGDIATVDLWQAVRPLRGLLDLLPLEASPADVGRVLRAVADVLDPAAAK